MKEIPIVKVRSNQLAIVVVLAIAIGMQIPWLIAIVWLAQILTRFLGSGANAFVIILEPMLTPFYKNKEPEAEELQKFNLSISIVMLSISMVLLSFQQELYAYIVAGIVALAALAALLGYCIGCTIYYQYKKLKQDRK